MNEKNIKYLREKIFKTNEYYQFELLFRQAREIERKAPFPLGILERAYIYNGKSIFSSVFSKMQVVPIDYRPVSAKQRKGFQSAWIDEAGLNCTVAQSSITDNGKKFFLNLKNKQIKTLFIPNVIHHCRDFPRLIKILAKKLPKLRYIFIFDSYIRENHQEPDDFCRYTPSALKNTLLNAGFTKTSKKEIGNVFDCILYFISQAQKNLNRVENSKLKLKIEKIIPDLRKKRKIKKYRFLGRKHAGAATGYSISFKKID